MIAADPAAIGPRGSPAGATFVAMMATLIALHALSIDMMLPALPQIGQDLAVTDSNRLQWIVAAYVTGMGCGQLFCGPLSDRFGRRPVVLTAIGLFVVISLLAASARSLSALLALRALQGVAVSAAAVVPRAIVRDTHAGAGMARVMSTILLALMLVPVLAPSLGQALLLFADWRSIFLALALAGVSVGCWVALRLPETLKPADRRPLSATHLLAAARFVLTEPTSILYTVAMAALYGSLLAFISLMPQILEDGFQRLPLLGVVFALCAGTMGLANFVNSRFVERVGMRRISHAALLGFLVFSGVHALVAWQTPEPLWVFVVMQAATMACFALTAPNFGAIAMQPMAHIAGSAASLQGVISTVGGALVSSLIGYQWSGSIVLLPAGALCCGLIALGCVQVAEKGAPGPRSQTPG